MPAKLVDYEIRHPRGWRIKQIAKFYKSKKRIKDDIVNHLPFELCIDYLSTWIIHLEGINFWTPLCPEMYGNCKKELSYRDYPNKHEVEFEIYDEYVRSTGLVTVRINKRVFSKSEQNELERDFSENISKLQKKYKYIDLAKIENLEFSYHFNDVLSDYIWNKIQKLK